MSSILKALKRVEDDKTARRPEQLNIDADILKSDNFPRFSTSGVIITSLLLLALGSGATYMFMKSDKTPDDAGIKSPAVSFTQSQRPVINPSDIKTEQLPEAIAVVPANQKKPAVAESVKRTQTSVAPTPTKTAPVAVTTRPVTPPKPTVAPKPAEQAIVKEQASPPPPPPVKAAPVLRVNGIAFEDGATEGVAIVNGAPVTNGAMIEGVKVEEIHKNKVRFNFNGEKFEITLGQSNR